jgi:hypothetical protein
MTVTLGRRELLVALGGAAVAWPLAVRAQQPAMPVVGFLRSTSANASVDLVAALRRDFDTAFATLAQQQVEALLIVGNALFTGQRYRLVAVAARDALPAIYPLREFVAAGGLMSYGGSLTDALSTSWRLRRPDS